MWLELTTLNGTKTYIESTTIKQITPTKDGMDKETGCYLDLTYGDLVQIRESAKEILQLLEAHVYNIIHPWSTDEEILRQVNNLRNRERVHIALCQTKYRKEDK